MPPHSPLDVAIISDDDTNIDTSCHVEMLKLEVGTWPDYHRVREDVDGDHHSVLPIHPNVVNPDLGPSPPSH